MKHFLLTIGLLITVTTSIFSNTILTLGKRNHSAIDTMPAKQIKDTRTIKQDPTPFTKQIIPMSSEEQLTYDSEYNEKFFGPWQLSYMNLTEEEKSWQLKYSKEKTYRANGRKISKNWIK